MVVALIPSLLDVGLYRGKLILGGLLLLLGLNQGSLEASDCGGLLSVLLLQLIRRKPLLLEELGRGVQFFVEL